MLTKSGGTAVSEKTLTRMELSEAVFRTVGLSRNESAELVEMRARPHLRRAGARRDGEDLVLRHLQVRSKTARIGRNPKTGEEVPIEPRRVLTFRPSHIMKERVDAGNKR